MTDEPQNVSGEALAANPAAQAVVVPAVNVAANQPQGANEVAKPLTLKKFAWRTTATIYWVWWAISVVLSSEFLNSVTSPMVNRLVSFLSAVGFAPVHSEYLPRIFLVGWLLAIVGFRPLGLLGLYIYIQLAPLTLLGYLLFKEYGKYLDAGVADKKGLRPSKVRRPALTIVGLSLLGWLVLYGDAGSRRALMAGAILSGLMFFLLAGRAFQRVKPPRYPDGSEPASAFERIAYSLATSAKDSLSRASDAKKKSEVGGSILLYQKMRWMWRCFALLIRGQVGRNRLYLFLLIDYVVSLLVLAAAAVLFWAVTAKVASAPSIYPLTTFVRLCSSYFLPSIKAPSMPADLALWVQIGVSITAFILFVLFVGAAASLLPSRYSAYAERLATKYRIARKFAVSFARTTRALERIRVSKPR